MKIFLNAIIAAIAAMLVLSPLFTSSTLWSQSPAQPLASPPKAGGLKSDSELALSKFSRNEADLPKGPSPRIEGHPDLSGYWLPSRKDKPVGNIGKDLPGFKLPLTPAGQTALKYNFEHTIDPESLCIVGGIPRHDASALPFQLLQGSKQAAFLYWYTTYRLVPFDGRKHDDDPDPSFFGDEIGNWEGDTFVVDSIAFKDARTWADENANPHSDQLHTIERWTRPDAATCTWNSPFWTPGSTPNPFIISGRGFWGDLTRSFASTPARKITWMRLIFNPALVPLVPTASAATKRSRHYHLLPRRIIPL